MEESLDREREKLDQERQTLLEAAWVRYVGTYCINIFASIYIIYNVSKMTKQLITLLLMFYRY